jgi:hypothetical protein
MQDIPPPYQPENWCEFPIILAIEPTRWQWTEFLIIGWPIEPPIFGAN